MPRTIRVKPLEQIKKNYTGAASEAASRYKDSIARVVWQANAVAGHDLWVERMGDPDVQARHLSGIENSSDAAIKEGMTKKGAPVLATRMRDAADKQARGYQPIRAALDGMSIPDKVADVDSNIDNILKPVVHAMRRAAGKES